MGNKIGGYKNLLTGGGMLYQIDRDHRTMPFCGLFCISNPVNSYFFPHFYMERESLNTKIQGRKMK